MSWAAFAGSLAPVMARPITRMSLPLRIQRSGQCCLGHGHALLVLHCGIRRADAGHNGEEIAP